MKAPIIGRIAILGTGLIGGSLCAALTRNHVAMHVAAYDFSGKSLAWLEGQSFIHSSHSSAPDAVKDADMVVLAVPPDAMGLLAEQIAEHLKPGCVVTDVASVKRSVIAAVKGAFREDVHFVPGHPVAGSEKSGAEAADPELFRGKRVILTPKEEEVLSEPVASVRGMWEALSMQAECMPAELHDRIYAYISHLPQLTAYAARPFVPDNLSGAEGVLRLSHSNVALWCTISKLNADYIREALDEFTTFLNQMSSELSEHAEDAAAPAGETHPATLLCSVIGLCLVATGLLLEQRTGIHSSHYSGNGFKDMVAAAGTQSDSVLGAISSQPKQVAALMQATLTRLNAIGAALSSGDRENIHRALSVPGVVSL